MKQYKFLIVGTLTALNGALMLFSNAHVPGVLQALLGPTIVTIPLSMLFSWLIIKRRFLWGHAISVLLILGGVLVAILPSALGDNGEGGASPSAIPSAVWAILFLCGSMLVSKTVVIELQLKFSYLTCSPLALLNVYEEKAFEADPIHINFMLANSVMVWQGRPFVMLRS